MEIKIRKALRTITKIDSVYYHDASNCGYLIINDTIICGIVINILSTIVEINAIRCIDPNHYSISFISKDLVK